MAFISWATQEAQMLQTAGDTCSIQFSASLLWLSEFSTERTQTFLFPAQILAFAFSRCSGCHWPHLTRLCRSLLCLWRLSFLRPSRARGASCWDSVAPCFCHFSWPCGVQYYRCIAILRLVVSPSSCSLSSVGTGTPFVFSSSAQQVAWRQKWMFIEWMNESLSAKTWLPWAYMPCNLL